MRLNDPAPGSRVRRNAFVGTFLLCTAGGLIACNGAGCGGGDVCPAPIIATGVLHGELVDSAGAPLRDQRVYSMCYGVGVSDRRTNDQGRFVARFPYMPGEPPADAVSGEPFVRYCRVGLEARIVRDSIPVTFYPDGLEVVPTEVRLTVAEQ